ncbi:MAG TPA: tetratricopeptide repeat protein [Chitinophagaceae bacterium]|nr:tetratricopeptide repeat protein [Chitinophagaceae bacterium]
MKYNKPLWLITIFLNLFISFLSVAQSPKTVDSLEQLLKNEKEDTNRVKLLNKITYQLIDKDNNKAAAHGNEAIDMASRLNFKSGLAEAYDNISAINYKHGNYKEAMGYTSKALSIHQEINDQKGIAVSLTAIGNIYLDQGNYDSALSYQFRSLEIYKRLGFVGGMGVNYNDIGLIYLQKADYKTALDYTMKHLKIEEETGDKAGIANAYNSFGNIYFAQGAYDKAIEYQQKAKVIDEELGDKQEEGYALNNIANAYVQKGSFSEALKYYYSSLEILEKLGNKKGVHANLDNIGAVYYFQKKYPEAIQFFTKSKQLSEECGDKLSVASSSINIGEVNLERKQYADAIKYYNEGINVARQIGAKDRMRDGYKGLSDAYTAKGDFKNGYNSYKLFSEIKDSISTEASTKNMNDLQIRYETEKKDKENDGLKKDKIIDAAKIKEQKNGKIIWAISSVSILLVGSLGFYFWRKRKNYRFEQQISEVQQEALNAQMSDHFISNAMDSINNFIENNDKEKASEYLMLFNRLIRKVLENSFKKRISLKDETEVLKIYIELEKLRFTEGTLNYEITIDEAIDAENTFIPPMIFQVLCENAIKHGFKKTVGGKLKVNVEKKDATITCTVEDNGMGRQIALQSGSGADQNRVSFGGSLAEKLIKTSSGYGWKSAFKITDLTDENKKPLGTKVEFTLPYIYES